jgi:hypothetical protein
LHSTFNLPYVYDHIKNCAGNTQKIYKIMKINMFTAQDLGGARCRKYRRLKLGGGQAYSSSND